MTHPAVAESVALRALRQFVSLKPLEFGAPGTRDIDVAKWRLAHEAATEALAQSAPAVVAESAEQRADQWRKQFWEVARMVKCLPSSFPEDNGHVFKKLSALVREAPRDGANMPDAWSVLVEVAGDRLVCIEQDALSGKRNLSDAEEQAIVGAAQHLLAFVGYGLQLRDGGE